MNANDFFIMLIPAVVSVLGGVLAALWRPSRRARSQIQHFAAGVVLAALAVELFPEIASTHAPGPLLAGAFGVGSLLMYGLKVWTSRMEKAEAGHPPSGTLDRGLLLATFIDVAVDGFIIGAGFAAGGTTGLILALGLSVELLFLGLALTSDAARGWRIIGLSSGLGATVLVFAVLGSVVLAGASHAVIGGALAFSAAALLYLVTEELLMEAHEVPDTPGSTLVLFGGFLAFWVVQLFGA
jgi:zinc transporter, ZIP family